jgi:hypothetical protein
VSACVHVQQHQRTLSRLCYAPDVAKKRVLALLSTNPHDDVSNLVCSLSFHSDSDKKFARLLHAQRADHLLVVTSGSEQINPTKNESSRAYYLLC